MFALLCLVSLQVSSFLSHLQFSFSCKFCRLAELLARTGQHQQRMMKEEHRSSPENIFVIITLRIMSNLTNVAMSHCLSIAKPWSRPQSVNPGLASIYYASYSLSNCLGCGLYAIINKEGHLHHTNHPPPTIVFSSGINYHYITHYVTF